LSSRKFSKRWDGRNKGFKGSLRPSKPLKPRIGHAVNCVELQIRRLENYIDNYGRRDENLFERIVQAYESNDNSRVKILANELTEVRKHKRILMQNKLALDNIAIRLRTLFEYGNFVSTATPIVGILENIKSDISTILPDVGAELGNVETILTDIVDDMGQNPDLDFSFESNNDSSKKIIKDAALIVENRMKTNLPDLSTNISSGGHLATKRDSDID